MKLTDDEIIEVRKATRVFTFDQPWCDSLAFARASEAKIAEAAANKAADEVESDLGYFRDIGCG
jgi:hypothetical protein